MKAFLLTAGLGMRLRPLTNDTPKCLLPLGGKPLLEIWLELLGKHGVTDVLVNTHWRREKVERYIKDRSQKSEGQEQRTAVYAPAVLAHCRGRKLRRAKEVGGREGTEVIRLRKATPCQGGRRSEVRHTDG